MKALYLDCFAGISGNMLLGAFLDAGVPAALLQSELNGLKISGYELKIERVEKQGVSAIHADVVLTRRQHHHRHLADIYKIIDDSDLPQPVKSGSKAVFLRLAEAEAKVHGTTVNKIHFHEVGAIDSIVDIVGAVFCLHYLGIDRVYASSLQAGSGFVRCSHGQMPVPAPATAELLQGIPWYSGNSGRELVTPTGAAFLSVFGYGYGDKPANFTARTIGYGAGGWDLDFPNVLRMYVGELSEASPESIYVVETNIDDMNPQVYDYVMDRLLAAGALDVWLTPIIMKKGRPAVKLSLLVPAEKMEEMAAVLFAETSTIGVRYYPVERKTAERHLEKVQTPWGEARAKVSTHNDTLCSVTAEYDDCRLLAEQTGVPLRTIQRTVEEAARRGRQ